VKICGQIQRVYRCAFIGYRRSSLRVHRLGPFITSRSSAGAVHRLGPFIASRSSLRVHRLRRSSAAPFIAARSSAAPFIAARSSAGAVHRFAFIATGSSAGVC
jgi:hypothetical protein